MENKKKTNPDDLCLNCMQDRRGLAMCPYCGWQKGTGAKELYHLRPGTQLNSRYLVGTVVGSGGFGIIYTAWDMSLLQKVAIKEYYPTGLVTRAQGEKEVIVNGEKNRGRFEHGKKRYLDEARALATFESHSGIVSVLDFFQENNTAYIVMEFLEGIQLKDYLKIKGGKLPYSQALSIIRPLFDALSAVHSKKIIHRDISPDNVFITTDGHVKLIDFGAAHLNDGEELDATEVILKPGFAPPEQYSSRTKFSDQTDVYALSALFYLLITGMVPQESLARVSEDRLLPFSEFELDEQIPKNVTNAIYRGMAIDKSIRFKSVRDLEAGIEGRKITDAPEVLRKKRKFRNRIAVIAGALTIVALLALIPVWYTYFRPRNGLAGGTSTEAQISVLVTDQDSDMYNTLIREFEKEFKQIEFTLIVVPENEYEAKFIEMLAEGNPPTIYLNHLVQDDAEPPRAKLDRLYRTGEIEYAHIDQMNYKGSDWVAFSLDFPVMYYNLDLLDEIDYSTSQLSDKGFEDEMTTLLTQEGIEASVLAISDESKAWFLRADDTDSDEWGSIMDQVMTESEFVGDKVVFYIDKVSKLRTYQEKMPGYVGVTLHPSFKEASLPGVFRAKYSIPESVPNNERDAAMLFMYFLMNDYAQNVMTVQNDNGYPLNTDLHDTFLDSHQDLDEFVDLLNSIVVVE